MITIDKVTYRNLQEQVQKNKEDIAAWQNVEFTLNNFGIKVLGKVDSESDIPAGTYEYGDAYLVGLTDPYDLYIYTRNKEAADSGSFVNVGPLNVIGQEGPQGPQGPAGVDGYSPVVRYGNGLPIVESTDKDGYLYIDQQTSRLYTFKDNKWNYVVNMQGAKGDKGEQGIQGATGTTLSIVARLASPDLLPTNFASGAIPKNSAYLVDVQGANHLYIILGNQSDYSTWYWADAGDFNLGSVLYKDSVFQQYANITDSYDTNTGAVVTDSATNKLNNDLKSQIGDLSTLGTSDKSSLVNAINEVKNSGGSGGDSLPTISELNEWNSSNLNISFINASGTMILKDINIGYKNGVMSLFGIFILNISSKTGANPGVKVELPSEWPIPENKTFSYGHAFKVSSPYDASRIDGIRQCFYKFDSHSLQIRLSESYTNVSNGYIYKIIIPLTYVKL